jgi:arylsulfatase A
MPLDKYSVRVICHLLAVGLGLALASSAPAAQRVAADRPNVIVIVIDDLGWADLGCYGSKFYRTPNLDRLAADGMRFTQAYAACPVCSPTRAALLTGKYPARLHLTDYIPGQRDSARRKLLRPDFLQQLPLEEVTVAEALRSAGYVTAALGKWHLGGEGFEPTRQGFDVAKGGVAAGAVPSHFAPYLREGQTLPGLEQAPQGEYLADRLMAEAETFLAANRERPFFLYLPHYAVHTPIMGKAELIANYSATDRPPGSQRNPIYAAMIENMDENVGRIVARLDALGLADNTIVIFTSDNGGLAR